MNLAAEWFQETKRRFAVVVDAVMRQREGTEQPAPDRALMISGVTIAGVTAIVAAVSGFGWRETPQSMRGQKMPCANIDNRLLLLSGERAHR